MKVIIIAAEVTGIAEVESMIEAVAAAVVGCSIFH